MDRKKLKSPPEQETQQKLKEKILVNTWGKLTRVRAQRKGSQTEKTGTEIEGGEQGF